MDLIWFLKTCSLINREFFHPFSLSPGDNTRGNKWHMRVHIKTHHGGKLLTCILCETYFCIVRKIERHMGTNHGKEDLFTGLNSICWQNRLPITSLFVFHPQIGSRVNILKTILVIIWLKLPNSSVWYFFDALVLC